MHTLGNRRVRARAAATIALTPLATVFLAAFFAPGAANAQPPVSYELRTRFAQGWGAGGVPVASPIIITAPGRYDFQLQEGVFNAQGFTNFGLANWIGQIRST